MSSTTDILLQNFLLSTVDTQFFFTDTLVQYIISLVVLVILLITVKLFIYKVIYP